MSSPDYEDWVGDEADGCWVNVYDNGGTWSCVVVVDSDTGSYCGDLADCDDFETADDATFWGRDRAIEWCVENDVRYDTDTIADAYYRTYELARRLASPGERCA